MIKIDNLARCIPDARLKALKFEYIQYSRQRPFTTYPKKTDFLAFIQRLSKFVKTGLNG